MGVVSSGRAGAGRRARGLPSGTWSCPLWRELGVSPSHCPPRTSAPQKAKLRLNARSGPGPRPASYRVSRPGIGFPSFAPSRGGHSSGAPPLSSRGLCPSWNGLATVKPDRELGTLCEVAGRKTAATLIIPTPVSRCGPHLIN